MGVLLNDICITQRTAKRPIEVKPSELVAGRLAHASLPKPVLVNSPVVARCSTSGVGWATQVVTLKQSDHFEDAVYGTRRFSIAHSYGHNSIHPIVPRRGRLEPRCNSEVVIRWVDFFTLTQLFKNIDWPVTNAAICHRDQS